MSVPAPTRSRMDPSLTRTAPPEVGDRKWFVQAKIRLSWWVERLPGPGIVCAVFERALQNWDLLLAFFFLGREDHDLRLMAGSLLERQ